MNKVINVLATMANIPSTATKNEIIALLENAEISTEQKKAILAQDSERLATTITNFPISMCSVVHPAEDEEEQQSQDESESKETKSTRNFVVNS